MDYARFKPTSQDRSPGSGSGVDGTTSPAAAALGHDASAAAKARWARVRTSMLSSVGAASAFTDMGRTARRRRAEVRMARIGFSDAFLALRRWSHAADPGEADLYSTCEDILVRLGGGSSDVHGPLALQEQFSRLLASDMTPRQKSGIPVSEEEEKDLRIMSALWHMASAAQQTGTMRLGDVALLRHFHPALPQYSNCSDRTRDAVASPRLVGSPVPSPSLGSPGSPRSWSTGSEPQSPRADRIDFGGVGRPASASAMPAEGRRSAVRVPSRLGSASRSVHSPELSRQTSDSDAFKDIGSPKPIGLAWPGPLAEGARRRPVARCISPLGSDSSADAEFERLCADAAFDSALGSVMNMSEEPGTIDRWTTEINRMVMLVVIALGRTAEFELAAFDGDEAVRRVMEDGRLAPMLVQNALNQTLADILDSDPALLRDFEASARIRAEQLQTRLGSPSDCDAGALLEISRWLHSLAVLARPHRAPARSLTDEQSLRMGPVLDACRKHGPSFVRGLAGFFRNDGYVPLVPIKDPASSGQRYEATTFEELAKDPGKADPKVCLGEYLELVGAGYELTLVVERAHAGTRRRGQWCDPVKPAVLLRMSPPIPE